MRYARILAEFYGRAWAVPEELLLRMQNVLRQQSAGVKWSEEEVCARIADSNRENGYIGREQLGFRYVEIGSGSTVALAQNRANSNSSFSGARSIAVLPITGIIAHRMNLIEDVSGPGGTSIQKLQAQFREALAADQCQAIVLDVDSPGGSVDGVPELAEEIYQARKIKPIIACVNTMCASAAYWLGSAAGEVVCMPSGSVGSIGVYMVHEDLSRALDEAGVALTFIKAGKYKTEGNPSEPLSPEARDHFQEMVDDLYSLFVNAVAKNRGTTQAKVRSGYGEGRALLARDALKVDLIDGIGTFDSVLAKLGVGTMTPSRNLNSSPAFRQRQRELDMLGIGTAMSNRIPGNQVSLGSQQFLAGTIPHEKAEAKDDSPEWDGAAAKDRLAKWASSDGSGDKDKIDWAKYRRGFAWYDSANADNFGAYKFPHHDVKNDKLTLVWGGVKAAMGSLLGARGGSSIPSEDRKGVYDHLAAHYREFDKEPPEYHSELRESTNQADSSEADYRKTLNLRKRQLLMMRESFAKQPENYVESLESRRMLMVLHGGLG